jgi:hypothetical protein
MQRPLLPRFVLAVLALAAPLTACGGRDKEHGPPREGEGQAELWFRRDPWRPAPEPEPEAPPVKKPTPPGAKEGPKRQPLSIPGPVAPAQWKIIPWKPGPSSDTITLERGQKGLLLEDSLVQASARTALIGYQGSGPFDGTKIRNCIFRVEDGTVPDGRSYWGLRGYDMRDTTLENVEITGFGKPTQEHDEGHAIYFNLGGSLTLQGCFIHHNGGQGVQLVNRPNESSLPRGPAAGTITVSHTWFHENGFNPDRGGSQVSIFGTGQDVSLSDVEIVAGRDATLYPEGRTGGGLLIEAEGYHDNADTCWWCPPEPDQPGQPTRIPFTQGRVVLEQVLIDQVSANRPIAQIKGCSELIVRNSVFRGGQVALDDPSKAGRPCGRIEWSGNGGDAEVYLNGNLVGPANKDFVAVDGVLQ